MSDDPRDFWDLSALVPTRKNPPKFFGSSHDTEAVEITAPAAPASPRPSTVVVENSENTARMGGYDGMLNIPPARLSVTRDDPARVHVQGVRAVGGGEVPLSERPVDPYAPKPVSDTPERTYQPRHSLLREVRIYPWRTEYTYYEQFRSHAERLHSHEGAECPPADFFSYMPQYTQLTREQLAYYLWWRTCFRQEELLPAAFSYLLLYLYEQINLSGKIDPKTGAENMLRLWLGYRAAHPRLDTLVREWLCDYSLLHALPPPALPRGQFGDLLAGCRLKEFYVTGSADAEDEVLAILLFCNNYDYKKSKFYRADTAELYDRVLTGAIGVALRFLREGNAETAKRASGISTVTRDAFSGAVCSWRMKRRIEVDFASFSHTHELRYIMTDVLKYCENAIRAALSIKSRLTVYQVGSELRRVLDAYLETALPKKAPKRGEKTEVFDYERRYEVPVTPISPEKAMQIETESWETTQKLIEAFGAEDEMPAKPITSPIQMEETLVEAPPPLGPSAPVAPELPVAGNVLADALGEDVAFFRLVASGDRAGARAYATARGELADAIADRINTAAGDILGDILLEDAGGYYILIEDYREEPLVTEILQNN